MKNNEQKEIIIRDLRSKEKYILDDTYLNGYARFVGPYSTCVYNSLCRHANKVQKSWPSIIKIAEEHGIGRNSVINGIKRLEFWQIIQKDRIGKKANNRYDLLDKSCWIEISEVYLKDFSEVCHINFKGLRDKLQGFTRQTSIVRKHIVRKHNSKVVKVIKYNPKSLELSKLLYELIKKNTPAWNKKINLDQWAKDMDDINRIDKYNFEQIEFMINWVQADSFWKGVILCPSKLRKKFSDLIPKVKSQYDCKNKGKEIICQ